jgi:hypothetical protein
VDFQDQAYIPDQDVDGTGDPTLAATSNGISVHADINCMSVVGDTTVLGGVVRTSNIDRYVGMYVLLTVKDNGTGVTASANKFTWGFYRPESAVGCQSFAVSAYSFYDIESGNIQVSSSNR